MLGFVGEFARRPESEQFFRLAKTAKQATLVLSSMEPDAARRKKSRSKPDRVFRHSLGRIGIVLVILGSVHVCSWGQEAAMSLVLNELMASNGGCCPDPQGEFDDWIEIYNPGRRTVDVGGFYLTDNLDEPTKWQFPVGMPHLTRISSRQYLIVWADGDTERVTRCIQLLKKAEGKF